MDAVFELKRNSFTVGASVLILTKKDLGDITGGKSKFTRFLEALFSGCVYNHHAYTTSL